MVANASQLVEDGVLAGDKGRESAVQERGERSGPESELTEGDRQCLFEGSKGWSKCWSAFDMAKAKFVNPIGRSITPVRGHAGRTIKESMCVPAENYVNRNAWMHIFHEITLHMSVFSSELTIHRCSSLPLSMCIK